MLSSTSASLVKHPMIAQVAENTGEYFEWPTASDLNDGPPSLLTKLRISLEDSVIAGI